MLFLCAHRTALYCKGCIAYKVQRKSRSSSDEQWKRDRKKVKINIVRLVSFLFCNKLRLTQLDGDAEALKQKHTKQNSNAIIEFHVSVQQGHNEFLICPNKTLPFSMCVPFYGKRYGRVVTRWETNEDIDDTDSMFALSMPNTADSDSCDSISRRAAAAWYNWIKLSSLSVTRCEREWSFRPCAHI